MNNPFRTNFSLVTGKGGGRGEMAQTMNTHVSKCKIDIIKFLKRC
jgi:hypothetical protein